MKLKSSSTLKKCIHLAPLGAIVLSSLVEGSVRQNTPTSLTHCHQQHSDTGLKSPANYPINIPTGLKLFSEEQLSTFDEEGFLVVSGLLLDDEMNDLVAAAEAHFNATKKIKAYFSALEMGMIFHNETFAKPFRRVALDSILPQAAAELMCLGKDSRVRVLR